MTSCSILTYENYCSLLLDTHDCVVMCSVTTAAIWKLLDHITYNETLVYIYSFSRIKLLSGNTDN